ncbi:MAG: hypothetical protein P8M64_03260 [Thermodesulfobacteriota bacteirum]|jgi:hypothetical protein|nr:hypothetical protein [Thermodesulfobacteriota bacterium]
MKETTIKISVTQDGLLPEEVTLLGKIFIPAIQKQILRSCGFEQIDASTSTYAGVIPMKITANSKMQEVEFEIGAIPDFRKKVVEFVKLTSLQDFVEPEIKEIEEPKKKTKKTKKEEREEKKSAKEKKKKPLSASPLKSRAKSKVEAKKVAKKKVVTKLAKPKKATKAKKVEKPKKVAKKVTKKVAKQTKVSLKKKEVKSKSKTKRAKK